MSPMTEIFPDFVRAVVQGDVKTVRRRLAEEPSLATSASRYGATRLGPKGFFIAEIAHYFYAGDTALHIAAAAFRHQMAELLIKHGARVRARNRRGAEPLHYAADTNHWSPSAQAAVITYLISVGADPNALDASGVAPLHRAVRTRSCAAVKALLDGGADPTLANRSGSTARVLASRTTGRSGSGSPRAREQQVLIQQLLDERLRGVAG